MSWEELGLRSLLVSAAFVIVILWGRWGGWRDRILLGAVAALLVLPGVGCLPQWELRWWVQGGAENLAATVPHPLGPGVLGWIIWTAGSSIVFARWLWSGRQLRRRLAVGETCRDPRVLAQVEEGAQRFGLARLPGVELHPHLSSPAVRPLVPRLLLPADALAWDTTRLRAVVLHELAHLSRQDLWREFIFRGAEVIYWWNPLVWWLARQHRRERELHCDAMAVGAGLSPASYATTLLELAIRPSRLGSVAMGDREEGRSGWRLEDRVRALYSKQGSAVPTGFAPICCLLLLAAVFTAISMIDPVGEPSAGVPQSEVELRLSADPFPG